MYLLINPAHDYILQMATKERRRFFPFTETKRVNPPNKMGDVEKQVSDMLRRRLPDAKI